MIALALGPLGRGTRLAALVLGLLLFLACAFQTALYSELTVEAPPALADGPIAAQQPAGQVVALGDTRWGSGANTYCESYVEWRTGIGNQGATAFQAYLRLASQGLVHAGPPPAGALVYFGPSADNAFDGHVGIADSGGLFTSVTVAGVQQAPLAGWAAPYLGWIRPGEIRSDRFGNSVTPTA